MNSRKIHGQEKILHFILRIFLVKYAPSEKPGCEDSKMKSSKIGPDNNAHRDSLRMLTLSNFRYNVYPVNAIYPFESDPATTQIFFNNSGIKIDYVSLKLKSLFTRLRLFSSQAALFTPVIII